MKGKLLVSLILLVLIISPIAFADGGMWVHNIDTWNLYDQKSQLAAIDYKDGFQNMLIQINLDDQVHGDKAVWIFPVPAPPEKVAVNIIKSYPIFQGENMKNKLESTTSGMASIYSIYSTFPLSMVFFPFLLLGLSSSGVTNASTRFTNYYNALYSTEGVTVHEVIQKMGVTSELITAKDATSLENYLKSKELILPQDSKDILNEYIGKDYSFVVSYIDDLEKFKQSSGSNPSYYGGNRVNVISVSLKFPTDRIFYPLRLTSVYGSTSIPMEINFAGYVSPDLYSEITSGSSISYYQGYEYGEGYKYYTKLKLDAPSKYFTKDLWISNFMPVNVLLAYFVINFSWLWGIILYALLSCVASLAAGMFVFGKDVPDARKRFLLLGLTNFLTLIGFSVATWMMKTKQVDLDPIIKSELKKKGLDATAKNETGRKFIFVICFIVIFLCLTLFSMAILNALL